MRTLYKGSKKIGKVAVKAKVDTGFVTATAADILSGKKSIDKDYKEITGTMTITDTVADLTSDASAIASEITLNKTAYVKGEKITGTAVRTSPKDFITGLVESYRVANNNIINAGDFVKFVEEQCDCGSSAGTVTSSAVRVRFGDVESVTTALIAPNKILLFISMHSEEYVLYGTTMTINGATVTFSTFQSFSNLRFKTLKLVPLSNDRFGLLHFQNNQNGIFLSTATVSENNVISITTSRAIVRGTIAGYTADRLPDDRIFIAYASSGTYICNFVTVWVTPLDLYNITTAATDRTITGEQISITVFNESTALLFARDPSSSNLGMLTPMDITDLTKIKTSTPFSVTLVTAGTTVIAPVIKLINSTHAAAVFYNPYASQNRPYITILRLNGGLTFSKGATLRLSTDQRATYAHSIEVLSDNTLAVTFVGTNVYTVPVTVNFNDLSTTSGVPYQVNTVSNIDTWVVDTILYDTNKLGVLYSDQINTYMSQIELKDGVFSSTLTTTSGPSTETMVALATGSDSIDGIADGYGVGRLYGGDTINIIKPNV